MVLDGRGTNEFRSTEIELLANGLAVASTVDSALPRSLAISLLLLPSPIKS